MDESAYISQSYFADLILAGDRDDPAWLEYPGYDLPPLTKYLVGFALRAEGFRRPGPASMRAWYANTSRQFVSKEALIAARRPSVFLGAIGCVSVYFLGALAFDRRVGLLAALLLMANPLYAMHARRAMSDVPAEALILATTACGLWGWKRILGRGSGSLGAVTSYLAAGLLCGLATLSKLNGSLAGFILAAWALLAMTPGRFTGQARSRVVALTIGAGVLAILTFLALNPFLTAHPTGQVDPRLRAVADLSLAGRFRAVAEHRSSVSRLAMSQFPADALRTPLEKVEAVAVQGFGRFGPLGPRGRTDSTVRFDARQDRGAWAWLPWVVAGFVCSLARGRDQLRRGEPPAAWAIALQAGVALAVVTAFIPLAWDRYFLSIQPGSALLGAVAAVALFDLFRRGGGRAKAGEPAS